MGWFDKVKNVFTSASPKPAEVKPSVSQPVTAAKPVMVPNDHAYDDINAHYGKYGAARPRGLRATVCSAYGCKTQQKFTFSDRFIEAMKKLYTDLGVSDGFSERQFIKKAIAAMEKESMVSLGLKDDRPSIDLFGNGDPGQLDCVDEATNSTSFLLILNDAGLIKHHRILGPIWKGGLTRWTHYAALIEDRKTKVQYAIDSGVTKQGGEPYIIEEGKFYV